MTSTEDKLRKAKEEIHTSSVTDTMYKNRTELSNKSHAAEMERAGALIDPAYESKEDAEHYAELAKEYANRADNATQASAEALERANEAIAHSNAAIATINDRAAVVTESINTKADEVTTQATNAATSATAAATSATESTAQATLAKSYAQGGTGTRENEDLDNVVYYYQQIIDKLGNLQGALRPMGTITFAELAALTDLTTGDMYNISDEFTADDTFKDGAGIVYGAGTNVYRTADGHWDALPSACVAGIKGDKELTYRKGNVNMTPANLGAVASDGGDVTNTTVTLEGFVDYTLDQLNELSDEEVVELFHTWGQSTNYLADTVPSSASLKDYLVLALNNYVYNKFFQNVYHIDMTYVDDIASSVNVTQDTIGYTRKNLLKNTAVTTTTNGVTFTVNDNGSVTVNGTATENAHLDINVTDVVPQGNLIGSISSVNSGVQITFGYFKEDGTVVSEAISTYTKSDFVYPSDAKRLSVHIAVSSGTTIDNVTVYPMLRYASEEDDTYAPYVKDVDTRLNKLNTDLSNVGKRTVLWENTNANNATFAAQTLSMDLSDADEIEIYCCVNNLTNYGVQVYRFLFVSGTIAAVSKSLQGGGNYNTLYIRTFTMYDDKIVVANGAVQASTGTNTVNNNAQVPFKIVKIKY